MSKAFGSLVVLDEVSFSIPKGETTAIIEAIWRWKVGDPQAHRSAARQRQRLCDDRDMGLPKLLTRFIKLAAACGNAFKTGPLLDSMTVGEKHCLSTQ